MAFVDEIAETPGGEGIRLCIQCGTCTASCPNADRMEHTPSQLIAMARAGLKKKTLSSNAPWLCISCYTCTVRCPRGIKPTELMHALEAMAIKEGLASKSTSTPAMYRTFSNYVYRIGTLPEFGFMQRYYMRTNPFRALRMLPIALDLIRHGRLSLKERRLSSGGAQQLKAILNKANVLGGQ